MKCVKIAVNRGYMVVTRFGSKLHLFECASRVLLLVYCMGLFDPLELDKTVAAWLIILNQNMQYTNAMFWG